MMQPDDADRNRNDAKPPHSIDPIANLPLPSAPASICFVNNSRGASSLDAGVTHEKNEDNSSDDDESVSSSSISEDEELAFRSSHLQRQKLSSEIIASQILSGRFLASCHHGGEALLWDLSRQKNVSIVSAYRGGPGLSLKRMDEGSSCLTTTSCQILYQTRDAQGIVSLHSIDSSNCSMTRQYETYSETFCQAAPCIGNPHLVALPCREDNAVSVMDDRDSLPITTIPIPNHGMLTSLAMSLSGGGPERPILVCGMESGSVIFHDFSAGMASSKAEYNLTRDPILALDLVPSQVQMDKQQTNLSSVLAVAGMAGDAAEVSKLPQSQQGRVALLKATIRANKAEWNLQLRARPSTCRVNEKSYGKPGVSICRFRSTDGRLFAVGGWDNRVRLYERSKGAPMAILRGHAGSVCALDWSLDAVESGLLAAAGGGDNRIYFWRCFPK